MVVSPELADVLSAIIFRVRGEATEPFPWSRPTTASSDLAAADAAAVPAPDGSENRPITGSYVARQAGRRAGPHRPDRPSPATRCDHPHDFRRIFVTDAILYGLPPAHRREASPATRTSDTTMGYKAAIYPEDVIRHHRAFIARRRAVRPSEEYRELTADENGTNSSAHFELRKVALGDLRPRLRHPMRARKRLRQMPAPPGRPSPVPRLEEIHANLVDRLQEAEEQGWLGEVAAIETTMAAAAQKLTAMRELAARGATVNLGMPEVRGAAGRSRPSSRTAPAARARRPPWAYPHGASLKEWASA